MSTFLRRIAPLAGVALGALIIVAFIVSGNSPGADATGQHVVDYYTKHHDAQRAVGFLFAYAGILAVIFGASLRSYLRGRTDSTTAIDVGFAGFVIFAVGVATFGGLGFALTDQTGKYETAAAQALNILDDDLFITILVGLAALLLGSGFVIVVSGALPKWLGWVTLVIGVVVMTPIGFFGLLAFLAWSAVVSIWIFIREGKQPSAGAAGAAPEPAPAG